MQNTSLVSHSLLSGVWKHWNRWNGGAVEWIFFFLLCLIAHSVHCFCLPVIVKFQLAWEQIKPLIKIVSGPSLIRITLIRNLANLKSKTS